LIRSLLIELLRNNQPEFGARLKQRLISACIAQGLETFSEREYGYSKFSQYLLGSHGDIVSITRPEGAGDILVSLATSAAPATRIGAQAIPVTTHKKIKNDVWQAFANPDPRRKRYLSRTTAQVLHFLGDEDNGVRREIAAAPEAFVEIQPISGAEQLTWMREFLSSLDLRPSERSPLEALLASPYSSQLNAIFTKALAAHSAPWKEFRVKRIIQFIEEWAATNHIAVDRLFLPSPTAHPLGAINVRTEVTSRQQAIKLLDLVTDDDVANLIMPTIVATILIRSRT